MATRPSMKSVGSLGIGNGFQRRRLGVTSPNGPPASCRASLAKAGCLAEGWMRYIQVRRASLRVMVKAVPENSSAYRP